MRDNLIKNFNFNIKIDELDEHTDYIFQKEIKSGKSIWYLKERKLAI